MFECQIGNLLSEIKLISWFWRHIGCVKNRNEERNANIQNAWPNVIFVKSGPFVAAFCFIFVFSIQLILPMTGFEPQTSGVGSAALPPVPQQLPYQQILVCWNNTLWLKEVMRLFLTNQIVLPFQDSITMVKWHRSYKQSLSVILRYAHFRALLLVEIWSNQWECLKMSVE